MELKRIGPLSCGKISALLYGILGFLVGLIMALMGMIGTAFGGGDGAAYGMFFGVGAIIIMPIFYAIIGFVGGIISAAIYNLVAQWIGGVEVEFSQTPDSTGGPGAVG